MLVDAGTFDLLRSGGEKVDLKGVQVMVPSLPHLIALKLHALRHGGEHRRGVDLGDIAELVRLNQVDLATEPYPEILERYGTAEIQCELAVLLGKHGPRSAGG